MSRRLVVLSVLVLSLMLAAGTLAIASGGKTRSAPVAVTSSAPSAAPAAAKGMPGFGLGGRHGGALMKIARKVVLDSLARRLDVTPVHLRSGVHAVAVAQFEKAAKTAGLTSVQTDALKACHSARRKARRAAHRTTRTAACDRATIRPALKKLKALPEPDLAALKTELSDALAAQLGGTVTGTKVIDAVRAELDQRLGQLSGFGLLTDAGRTQALTCFDSPATCDEVGLRKELRGPLAKMAARAHRR